MTKCASRQTWSVADDDDVDVDDSNTPVVAPLPSSTDITSALTLVRRWLEAQVDAANGFTLVAEWEELCGRCLSTSIKQASIENYFQPL